MMIRTTKAKGERAIKPFSYMNTISLIIFTAFVASIILNFSENSMIGFFEIFVSYFLAMFVLVDKGVPSFLFFFFAGMNTVLFIILGAIVKCSKRMLIVMYLSVFVNFFMVLDYYYGFYSILSQHYVWVVAMLSFSQLYFINFGGKRERLSNRLLNRLYGVFSGYRYAGINRHGFKGAINR